MNEWYQQYQEVIAFTQLYLLQEHKLEERMLCSTESYAYYKEFATKMRSSKTQVSKSAPIPTSTVPVISNEPVVSKKIISSPSVEKPKENTFSISTIPLETPAPIVIREKKTEEKTQTTQTFSFQLQPFEDRSSSQKENFRKLIQQYVPNFPLLDDIPCDQTAKALSLQWQQKHQNPAIVMIIADQSNAMNRFLNDLAHALRFKSSSLTCLSCQQYEVEFNQLSRSSTLKFVISTPQLLERLPHLKQHLKNDEKGKQYLGSARIILLKRCERYFQDFLQKKRLWQMLCAELGL